MQAITCFDFELADFEILLPPAVTAEPYAHLFSCSIQIKTLLDSVRTNTNSCIYSTSCSALVHTELGITTLQNSIHHMEPAKKI